MLWWNVKIRRVEDTDDASICRKRWVRKAKNVCRHCFSSEGAFYAPYPSVQFCRDCRALESYNAISRLNASRYLSFRTKTVQKVIQDNNIRLLFYIHSGNTFYQFYQFQQLLEIAKMAYGPEKATAKAVNVRNRLGIRKMRRRILDGLEFASDLYIISFDLLSYSITLV